MNFTDYREIAKAAIKLAMNFDERIPMPTTERIDAWATILEGRAWPTEAEQAVYSHYAKAPCGMLMPGDIVNYCATQPPWSSLEHARDWILRVGVHNPYSGAIEAYSGIQEPVIAIPEDLPRTQHKNFLIEQLHAWATPRLEELANAIVAKQYRPWWKDQ